MEFSVQNASGEVYGCLSASDERGLSANEWAEELRGPLRPIMGLNGILPMRDLVIIDIDPHGYFSNSDAPESVRIDHVQSTIEAIARGEDAPTLPENQPEPPEQTTRKKTIGQHIARLLGRA